MLGCGGRVMPLHSAGTLLGTSRVRMREFGALVLGIELSSPMPDLPAAQICSHQATSWGLPAEATPASLWGLLS